MSKVYEEKERSWERELRKIKALYENRMKANQQKVMAGQCFQYYVKIIYNMVLWCHNIVML